MIDILYITSILFLLNIIIYEHDFSLCVSLRGIIADSFAYFLFDGQKIIEFFHLFQSFGHI
jgi:hypothetical protein